jgi:pyrroloquinoline quinone (PQQ) biosynthesis protein C
MLPTFLEELVEIAPSDAARRAVQANLSDELGPPTHLELFDMFVDELGADSTEPTPATAELLGAYSSVLQQGPATAFAGLAAYEIQAAGIATTKAAGLRTHYGIHGDGLRFWDTHGVTEEDHARWTLDALESFGEATTALSGAAKAVAAAWWSFLDERERVAQTADA